MHSKISFPKFKFHFCRHDATSHTNVKYHDCPSSRPKPSFNSVFQSTSHTKILRLIRSTFHSIPLRYFLLFYSTVCCYCFDTTSHTTDCLGHPDLIQCKTIKKVVFRSANFPPKSPNHSTFPTFLLFHPHSNSIR